MGRLSWGGGKWGGGNKLRLKVGSLKQNEGLYPLQDVINVMLFSTRYSTFKQQAQHIFKSEKY